MGHRIGPQVNLGAAQPFVAAGHFYVVPGIAENDAVEGLPVGILHVDEDDVHALGAAAVQS